MKKIWTIATLGLALSMGLTTLGHAQEEKKAEKKHIIISINKDGKTETIDETWEGEMPQELKERIEALTGKPFIESNEGGNCEKVVMGFSSGMDSTMHRSKKIVFIGEDGQKQEVQGHIQWDQKEMENRIQEVEQIMKNMKINIEMDGDPKKITMNGSVISLDSIENMRIDLEKDLKGFEIHMENIEKSLDSEGKCIIIKKMGNDDIQIVEGSGKNKRVIIKKDGDKEEIIELNDEGMEIGTDEKRILFIPKGDVHEFEVELSDKEEGTMEKEVFISEKGNKVIIIKKSTEDAENLNWTEKALTEENTFSKKELKGFEISPNPNKGTFKLAFKTKANELLDIRILDAQGRTMIMESYKGAEENFVKEFQIPNAVPGSYYLQIEQNGKKLCKKIIVE